MDLVVGATGLLGYEMCRQLRERGRTVRALIRPTSAHARVSALKELGVQLVDGDLKRPDSLRAACSGVKHLVTTASSTWSRAEGDDIESVDRLGNLNLIQAAADSGVEHVVLLSFAMNELTFPLQDAKRAAECALAGSGLGYTVLQPPHFLDVWFTSVLGFDAARRSARQLGAGTSPIHWVHSQDVARVASAVLGDARAYGQTLIFGGDQALSQRDVIRVFERESGLKFDRELVPEDVLREQLAAQRDPLEVSFAALMLRVACGADQPMDNATVRALLPYEPLSVERFAQRVLTGSS